MDALEREETENKNVTPGRMSEQQSGHMNMHAELERS